MEKTYTCHKIAKGKAKGELLFTKDPLCFYLIDPKTGKVIEKEHELYGQSITGKILVFPYGKGSSVVQADGLYQLQLSGMSPAGLIVTTLAASAIIFDMPLANRLPEAFYKEAKTGDIAELDADGGTLMVQPSK